VRRHFPNRVGWNDDAGAMTIDKRKSPRRNNATKSSKQQMVKTQPGRKKNRGAGTGSDKKQETQAPGRLGKCGQLTGGAVG
jgi:hypothetical protein